MKSRELERRLRAVRDPLAPPDLEARLEQGIPDFLRQPKSSWIPGRQWTMAKIGALTTVGAAAALVLGWITVGLLVGPAGTPAVYAAALEPVAHATDRVAAVHVVLHMLTREGEDFSFVNLEGDLQPVEAWIEWPRVPGDAGRARMDKPDRIYGFDGTETIFYHPKRNEAFRGGGRGIDVELFWPAAWVRQIRNRPQEGVIEVATGERDGQGWLILREEGADTSPLEPVFLGDFERETEVEWDLETHLLTGLRRWIVHEGERRLFSELMSIDYLTEVDDDKFRLDLPEDVRWGGVKEGPMTLTALGPREVAVRLFESAKQGDRETLELFCPSPNTVDLLLGDFRPTEVLFVGEPFRSGRYPGVFVPYRVRLGGADEKAWNLALRRDNVWDRWVFDGGL